MMTDQAALRQHIKELEEALTLPWWDVDDDTRAVLQAELDDCKEKLTERYYMVKPEYMDKWLVPGESADAIILGEEYINRLAREWDMTMDELLEQMEEI